MFSSIQTRLKQASRLLPVALLPFAAQAQFNYAPANAVNTAGTYTDLGTTGSVIATANNDDANSAAQPIGFSFTYNGTAFTQFVLSTNGFIKLGSTPPSATNLFICNVVGCTNVDPVESTDPADVNLILPFNFDLEPGTGTPEYRVFTTGTAPNRVCTIQWKNVSDKADATPSNKQYTNFSFQAKLYETTNNIEFVYGTATASTATPESRFPNVGLKGSSAATGQDLLASKTTGAGAWSTTTFITGSYPGSTHNIRNSALPDAGRTYRFVPTVLASNDAAVTAIYTLGKVSTSFGSPVTAQVVITNAGSAALTNQTATLTVSGATTYTNTQTIATLAPGASTTLTFTYPVTATTGTNTLTATVPNDGVNTNNTQTFTQTLSTNTLSYVSGTSFDGAAGLSSAGNVIATGYRTTGAAAVTTVTPYFGGAATTGSTYQILVYAAAANGQPGTVLYTSPARPRPAGAAGTIVQDVVSIPNTPVNGNFFVGIKTIGADNIGVAYQTETPLRPGTFFFTTTGTTWTDINTSTLNSRLAVDVVLSTVTATRNEALAATVGLAPNPAHGSFQLNVPAGNLHAATATLSNALGQVVLVRQLNLPAAGGTADFNVSNLANGVYSLTLKSGNDVVVKRVVVE
ncbi:T9SS type A sorting domain-containing protein [Hymenobacter properus]|uniref:T9SS type A sorting domain-containing protein n=1 Tax=Hymenobacter properus TaxID=2791026 RepID=A0A931BEN8_9BACT|nr:T9SS type A sorting domain-containing protein [Hymenobacter properus]MBF9142505.1 T9SS type A sorting domain-containing protein [Hymenobacter properus]MBR7721312.1 T9SS type A sorting domain-containing protein [Microvirga sp. SRT04]